MPGKPSLPRGRGAVDNPPNRYRPITVEQDPDWDPAGDPAPKTQFFEDHSETILTHNDSPDVGANDTLNPYRGCEHGCPYCYARRTHDYLDFSSGLDFETRIMVKLRAPELLRKALSSPRWRPRTIGMSGVTDCYQPVERRLRITRQCLEVLAEFLNPVSIVTKNALVTRDLDLLRVLAAHQAVSVGLSVTSLDPEIARRMEPRASSPRQRLAAIEQLTVAGIPVGVLVAPIIPSLNDQEVPAILAAARAAGARWACYQVVRLQDTVAPVFESWLAHHEPGKQEKVLNQIRALHGGSLGDSRFGIRMRGEGLLADQLSQLFEVTCRKLGFPEAGPELSAAAFRRPKGNQLELL